MKTTKRYVSLLSQILKEAILFLHIFLPFWPFNEFKPWTFSPQQTRSNLLRILTNHSQRQVVTVNKEDHERILLDSLNALFTSPPGGDVLYDYGEEEPGPLQLSIPIGLEPQAAPLQADSLPQVIGLNLPKYFVDT